MAMKLLALAMTGGALGAGARHLVNVGFGRWLGTGFPWWTFFVNVSGGLLMGVLIEALALRLHGSLEARTFLATGVLGGYTTFSAFSMDFVHMMQRHEHLAAGLYLLGSVALSILALYVGLWAARWLLT
jgi:CrcB protein